MDVTLLAGIAAGDSERADHTGARLRPVSLSDGRNMASDGITGAHVEVVRPPRLSFLPPAVPSSPPEEEVHYPDSDGSFLFQNFKHSADLLYAAEAVKRHLGTSRYVLAVDVFFYFREGDNKASLGPDLLVTLDHEFKGSGTYQTWVEGRLPDFILEVVSPSSVTNDKKLKKGAYERLGIKEYFLYDPDTEQSRSPVKGYRLNDQTRRYGRALKPGKDGSVRSLELGVSLRVEGSALVVRNTKTGEDYLPSERIGEQVKQVQAERDLVQAERDAEKARARQFAAEADVQKARARQFAAERDEKDWMIRRLERQLAERERRRPGDRRGS